MYLGQSADVVPFLKGLLKEVETVGAGGSRSLVDAGVIKFLKSGPYNFVNRSAGTTPEEREDMLRRCLLADTFLSSANALTEAGEIYNVDMQGNRVAAMQTVEGTQLTVRDGWKRAGWSVSGSTLGWSENAGPTLTQEMIDRAAKKDGIYHACNRARLLMCAALALRYFLCN